MTDYCKYVDVFYGNGEVDHYAEQGIGSKWYYIKALCGNTISHATLPFGKMSVGAYSGGYPCGYGTHYPNCCGGIKKLGEAMTIKGFSHIHHLIFMLYPDMSKKIAVGIVNISRTLGKIPCSLGLTNIFPCEMQAKMLGIFALCDAYYAGVDGITESVIEECIERELQRDDYKMFLESGVFDRYTHILDVADACQNVSKITKSSQLKAKLKRLYQNLENACGADGLLSENSEFYEGDRYTYSFRIHANMDDRIKCAGGKEAFEMMLDSFFGFGKESIIQPRYIGADKEISSNNYHRFQGFNNECDMETPYSYIYAGNHDKLCEIIHECVHRSFALGRGGIP